MAAGQALAALLLATLGACALHVTVLHIVSSEELL